MDGSSTAGPSTGASSSGGSSGVPSGAGPKKARTRTGCYTCRRRKKLCDNERPTCGSCNRLGIPCVFPKLYLNTAGEWVPSPQPNGRGKRSGEARQRSRSSSAQNAPPSEPPLSLSPNNTFNNRPAPHAIPEDSLSELAPWAPAWDADTAGFGIETSRQASSSNHPQPTINPPPTINPAQFTNPPYNPFETQAPFNFASTSLSPTTNYLTLSTPSENGAVTIDDILKELGFDPAMTDLPGMDLNQTALPMDMDQMQAALGFPPASLKAPSPPNIQSKPSFPRSNQALDQAGLTSHLPMLLDHWVNSFSRVVSVLGPSDNSLVTYLVPLAERSQLVLCALVGWAASHLSILGEPYVSMSNAAVETVETQVEQLDTIGDVPEQRREECMMALLILGGIDVCRGDSRSWVARLPKTRKILRAASATTNVCTSQTWRSIALNLVYHDVLSSLASSKTPSMPLDFYQQILAASEYSPDAYMGLTMQIFSIIGETAVLASEISSLAQTPLSAEQARKLHTALTKSESVLARLKDLEVPAVAFTPEKVHLIAAFQTYKFAAELYLRQAVHHAGSSDLFSQILATRTMQHLRLVLGTSSESQMLFPLFLVGVNTIDQTSRTEIVQTFNRFNERVKCGNIQAVYSLLLEVWKRDPDGSRYVDWRKIADESETVISFA